VQSCRSLVRKPTNWRYLHDTRKSLFVWDYVVGLRGLELRTKRLLLALRKGPHCEKAGQWSNVNQPNCRYLNDFRNRPCPLSY
jgi:hypothetical protein